MSQKLKENITKEIESIAEKGLSAGNLPTAKTLLEMKKELIEIEEKEQGGVMGMPRYRENYREYRDDDEYARRRSYRDDYERSGSGGGSGGSGGYGARGGGGGRGYGGYGGYDLRMRDHMDRIMDGAESYEYGRDRYMHGGDEPRLQDGIEKLMYALCMFIESTMEFAETPQEKETIRRHLQKLNKL